MRRFIFAVHLRKGISVFLIFLGFMILLPILIVGIGTNKGLIREWKNPPGYNIKPNAIVFDNTNGGGPKIRVYITKENQIKEMYLEEYVRGVVAAEMPAEFGIEALKAQAVAARTFALSNMEEFGGTPCSKANGGDICDTVHSQVYRSKEEILKGWPESKRGLYWNKITDAVQQTIGQVLAYNGQIAMNVKYFSTSSGRTEDAVDVFSNSVPYLKSVESNGENESPKYETVISITYSNLAKKINTSYPQAKVVAAKLKNQISILKPRTKGGSVKEIKLGNITITGTQFRTILNLNSANFKLEFTTKTVKVITFGYGHGVGMSQWGARAMANDGSRYDEILKHYYQGIEIESLYK